MARLNQFIFIYGPPGVGKSKAGRILAESLALPFYDIDQEIELLAGKEIPDIFKNNGLDGFRKLETKTLIETLKNTEGVISLGGGALLTKENREIANDNGHIILLEAEFEVIKNRLENELNHRPLIQNTEELEKLLIDRKSHYESFDTTINTSNVSPKEISWKIQKLIGRFLISGMGNNYPVYVQENCLANLGEILKDHPINKNVMVITDKNVGSYYLEPVLSSLENSGFKTSSFIIPPGEISKNLNLLSEIWGHLLENGIDRKSTIIALGGGVVGDLAGFAAATYMRGIDWIGIPTSLLAMVDSSLGGKSGIDLPQGKNLAGAFHSPKLVIVDPSVLSTLPTVEVKNGLAEVIKHGVITDPALFEECSKGIESIQMDWTQIIRQAIAVKVKIILEDPYEQGVRATLNFGHTIGHAVESLSNFSIRHGEAVAIGMVQEAKLSENLGLSQSGLISKLQNCLTNNGLPTEIPDSINSMQILNSMKFDKKRKDGKIYFALPSKIGEVQAGIFVEDLKDQLLIIKEDK